MLLNFFMIGLGIGVGYAVVKPCLDSLRKHWRYVRGNRALGWDVTFLRTKPVDQWQRIPDRKEPARRIAEMIDAFKRR